MKKVFILAGIFLCGTAFAQQDDKQNKITPYYYFFKQHDNIDSFRLKLDNGTPIPPNNSLILDLQGKYSHGLPNGDKVFLLPQDNMPCVVPGNQHQSMPNITGPKDKIVNPPNPGHIPNPGRKWRVIPIANQR